MDFSRIEPARSTNLASPGIDTSLAVIILTPNPG
jgi:hypothetical protein